MSSPAGMPEGFRDQEFRRRRLLNWMLVGLLYSFFYMTRYNCSALFPTLAEVFGWTKKDLGIFETLLPLVYGLSVVFNAPLADRIGGRKAFLVGAVGVVAMNALFPLVPVLLPDLHGRALAWAMASVWGVNGYFQSFGALSLVKINAQWFHISQRGTFAGVFGVLIRLGLFLGTGVAPWLGLVLGWQFAFWIPAAFVALLFVLNLIFVRESPEEAGFGDLDTGDPTNAGERPSVLAVAARIFTSPTMWLIALASMMIGFVRRSSIDAWWFLYFKDTLHLTAQDTLYQVTSFGIMIAGILGGFTFGITSDQVFGHRRAPVIALGFLGMAVALGAFYLAGSNAGANVASLIFLSFFVNGAHGMVGGAASMDFGGRKGAATAAGMFDGMQYLAGAINGAVLGALTTSYGWQTWKLWPIPFALIGAGVMARLWNARPGRGGH